MSRKPQINKTTFATGKKKPLIKQPRLTHILSIHFKLIYIDRNTRPTCYSRPVHHAKWWTGEVRGAFGRLPSPALHRQPNHAQHYGPHNKYHGLAIRARPYISRAPSHRRGQTERFYLRNCASEFTLPYEICGHRQTPEVAFQP